MSWVIGTFLVTIGLGVLFLWICARIRQFARSRFLIRNYTNEGYKEIRCPSCTLGTQYLHHETGWGPIPRSVRMIVPGVMFKKAGQANCRRCNDCGGNGYTATRDETMPDTGWVEV